MQLIRTLLCFILIFIKLSLISSSSPTLSQQASIPEADPCLSQNCDRVNVSYPFTLSDQCPHFSPFFQLQCNSSTNKLFFNNILIDGNQTIPLQVIHITNDSLVLDITALNATLGPSNATERSSCNTLFNDRSFELPPFPGPFLISDENSFGSFGCGVFGTFTTAKLIPSTVEAPAPAPNPLDAEYNQYNVSSESVGGCAVFCPNDEHNPACNDQTCCITPLAPESFARFASYFVTGGDLSSEGSPCVAARSYVTFFHPNYSSFTPTTLAYHLKLKWALPSDPSSTDYGHACSNHSTITYVTGVPGYLCSCRPGYHGDGYFHGSGCHDINECFSPERYCDISRSTCKNSDGNYTCNCKSWFHVGDGRKDGSGCHVPESLKLGLCFIGAILGLVLMLAILVCLAMWWRERTKRRYFMENGGLQLQTFLRKRKGRETKIFKAEELKFATDNYADHMKLGAGGFGTVFKGILEDGRVVAIKKANVKGANGGDSEQFANEIAILMQINHRHIVRLLGCCLETAVPLLVYEYVPNGNVAQNLGGSGSVAVMGWQQRLKVAQQTAEALAYLHSSISPPILHRDVKSANVLLDDNLDAKVADFGLSRLIPDGVEQLPTAIQGTIGYLDPEYCQTFELNNKSDVYSFGVMLVELITGLKPVDSCNREPRFASLAVLFIHYFKEGKLDELIDARLTRTPGEAALDTYSSITTVAALARHCLAPRSSKRPAMSHVVDQLRHIVQSLQVAQSGAHDESIPLLSSEQSPTVLYDDEDIAVVGPQTSRYDILQSGSIEGLLSLTLPR